MPKTATPARPAAAASIHDKVADRIINLLDQGNPPPWEAGFTGVNLGQNRNAITNAPYRGINYWLTSMTRMERDYQDPRWLTFNQAKAAGGAVKRGEKGTHIVFWKPPSAAEDAEDRPEAPDEPPKPARRFWTARQYSVFNLEQTEGCDVPTLPNTELRDHRPIDAADRIVREMPDPPKILTFKAFHGPPHYLPGQDCIKAPDIGLYHRPERWYCTLFHELVHATGHPRRLNRLSEEQWSETNLHAYGKEELVAGMGSAMLSALAGIAEANVNTDAAYIRGWRDRIAADKSMVIRAASLAQSAVDFITATSAPNRAAEPAQAAA